MYGLVILLVIGSFVAPFFVVRKMKGCMKFIVGFGVWVLMLSLAGGVSVGINKQQQYTLRVMVKPAGSKVVVAGEKVNRTATGSNKFGNLNGGDYTITVSKPGYQSETVSVYLNEDHTEAVGLITLKEARIQAQKAAREAKAQAAREAKEEAARLRKANYSTLDFQTQCMSMIQEKLKAPSQADFSFNSDPYETTKGYEWVSYVDAPNSFGVKLRADFVCSFSWATNKISFVMQSR
ncbi:PEGA domain-containing protein [Deinococcus cellulosilyticus]|uniref:PEGA domain-containing protein n=1 Tax=Deinococcus cellulosilyticus (strain DSM 18568 / NBRC 106333 / KACC 11606 / 5516J-15) TaxID=1223518 RepID=A0A511NB11_DEIC1|nr:PEGA domain-containing protein [Deinococcus cellulosilyticus]GEM50019.1 hypothetical protein DC3_56540 [Deinococcus cellulosilyticus NBRC 106333 = KACC 11606]